MSDTTEELAELHRLTDSIRTLVSTTRLEKPKYLHLRLFDLSALIADTPELLDDNATRDKVLDTLEDVALNAALMLCTRHTHTRVMALNILTDIQRNVGHTYDIIQRFEKIAERSENERVGFKSLKRIWRLTVPGANDERTRNIAFGALEQQAAGNSDPSMRIRARHLLMRAAEKDKGYTSRALVAQSAGVEDESAAARLHAMGVVLVHLMDIKTVWRMNDLERLVIAFGKVATTPKMDLASLHMAEQGTTWVQGRLKSGLVQG